MTDDATTWVTDGDFGPGVAFAMQTKPGMNAREHFRVRAKRVKAEREVTAWELKRCTRPPVPCTVLLTRMSPGTRPLDDDNLAGSLKAVRDEVAKWLGVDDGNRSAVRFRYAQVRAPWGVRVQFGPPVRGQQGVLDFIDLEV